VIVIDASVLVDSLVGEARAAELQAAETLAAPHLVDVEVGSAVRRLAAAGTVTAAMAAAALDDLAQLEVERHAHFDLLPRCWELRDNLTFYDAVYVALAEALDVPLVTFDARLASAPGIRATIEVLPIEG
jgi:predicted nucleic acid-binding protein